VFLHKILLMTAGVAVVAMVAAQQPPTTAQQPPVKVNVLNVCAPLPDQRKELSSALGTVPGKPSFSKDFEVSRGHSTLDQSTPIPLPGMPSLPPGAVAAADWVRVRREFPGAELFSNVQYSFSVDSKNMVETLVLRVREPKDVMEISIEDSASAVTSATAMLSARTPVSRIRLERFGKSSIVLARCTGAEGNPATDQSEYEPIFHMASSIMEHYRDALGAPRMVPQELTHLGVGVSARTATKPAAAGKKDK
jgi:hypothetical protein